MKTAIQNTPKVDPNVNAGLIEIFRAGKHTDMNGKTHEFSNADILAIANSYDAAASEAPLVVGHPQTNAPAYGWVQRLVAQDDVLLMQPHQVQTEFADMVNAGSFKKRSASFFMPTSPGNPTPGQFYLKHVGFLGAAAPAVKGLRDCHFADECEAVEFADENRWYTWGTVSRLFRNLRDWMIETYDKDLADKLIPDYYVTDIQEAARPPSEAASYPAFATQGTEDNQEDTTVTDKTAEFAQRESELAAQQQAITEREAKIAERETAARRADCTEFADRLVTEGRLLPKDKAQVIELLFAQPQDQTLSFADGDNTVSKGTEEVLRNFLKALPVQINFAEKSGGEATVDFADSNAVAKAATEFQDAERAAGREISTATAVNHIIKGNK